MTRRGVRSLRACVTVLFACVTVLSSTVSTLAVSLDKKGEVQIGLRAYTAARIGTEDTDAQITHDGVRQVSRSLTFPISQKGSLRQHRVFAEIDFRHDLTRLVREDFGPFALLNKLPIKLRKLRYFLSYRGEFEGIYDYGPSEFRTAEQFLDPRIVVDTPFPGVSPSREEIAAIDRRRLRNIGTVRNRLFQAYLQAQVGKVTLRLGRQILAWGETDIFRLLDNINPLDASFGGFLVSLDERRLPLDMLRTTWYLGDFSKTGIPGLSALSHLPWYEAYLEGFVAIDDQVGFAPGIAKGSAWAPPNLSVPSRSILTQIFRPQRTIEDARGGLQFRFSTPFPGIGDLALGAAHYYTYFDVPGVRVMSQGFPAPIVEPGPATNYSIWAQQIAPRVRVSGVFGNFALPPEWVRPLGISGEPIIRFETAYFKGEPRGTQRTLDPFLHAFILDSCDDSRIGVNPDVPNDRNLAYRVDAGGRPSEDGPYCTGGSRTGDSWNVSLGLDLQQWFRALNPNASFFISTQFFYRHLRGAEKREPLLIRSDSGELDQRPFYRPGQRAISHGEVLPVQRQVISPDLFIAGSGLASTDAAVPNFVHSPTDQFLQTLLITSPYYGGRVIPTLALFYDWANAWVVQPSLTYSVDPFRFTVSYSLLTGTDLKGGAGISLLRDRDNVLFQLEYVI